MCASGSTVESAQACHLLRQVFDVLLDLTRMDVVPTAVSQARHAHGTGSSLRLTLLSRCLKAFALKANPPKGQPLRAPQPQSWPRRRCSRDPEGRCGDKRVRSGRR